MCQECHADPREKSTQAKEKEVRFPSQIEDGKAIANESVEWFDDPWDQNEAIGDGHSSRW